LDIWIFGYLDIWIFGYLDIWIFGYLDIKTAMIIGGERKRLVWTTSEEFAQVIILKLFNLQR
jgi:hypothetical protein